MKPQPPGVKAARALLLLFGLLLLALVGLLAGFTAGGNDPTARGLLGLLVGVAELPLALLAAAGLVFLALHYSRVGPGRWGQGRDSLRTGERLGPTEQPGPEVESKEPEGPEV